MVGTLPPLPLPTDTPPVQAVPQDSVSWVIVIVTVIGIVALLAFVAAADSQRGSA